MRSILCAALLAFQVSSFEFQLPSFKFQVSGNFQPSTLNFQLLPWPLPPSHLVEHQRNASIDWTSHIVYSASSCELESGDEDHAIVRAYESAREQLIAALHGINITSTDTAGELLGRRAAALLELQRLASDPVLLAQSVRYGDAPMASILVGLDLKSSRILPLLVEGIGVGELQAGLPRPTPLPAAASAEWLSSIRHPTGLIIDARKVPLSPALCPAILAEDGRLVYDVRHAQRLWFMQHGGVTYMSDLDAAKADNLMGVNPKIVEALSVARSNGCDIIVSDDDADRLIFLRERLPFFAECRLIIVCQPIPNDSRQ